MKNNRIVELFGEMLDLQVDVSRKSDGKKIADWQLYLAGVVGAAVAFPIFLVLRFLFGR